jgi:hypothetical protein
LAFIIAPKACARAKHVVPHVHSSSSSSKILLHQRQFAPIAESKIKVVVRSRLLSSLKCPEGDGHSAPELVATMVSWAIYGAALAWCRSKAQRAEEFAMTVLPLMTAILQLPMGLEERET